VKASDVREVLESALHGRIDFQACWLVSGWSSGNGYAKVNHRGRTWMAHRLAKSIEAGNIPDGMMVLHTCRNRNCCNPEHLYFGTAKDNAQDSIRDGTKVAPYRGATACVRGHALSGDNLSIIRWRGRTIRRCRECKRARDRAAYRALTDPKEQSDAG